MNNKTTKSQNKTVTVKHKKSFSNTVTGNVLDKAVASAVLIAATGLATYGTGVLIEKLEEIKTEIRVERDIRKFMKQSKARYENSIK